MDINYVTGNVNHNRKYWKSVSFFNLRTQIQNKKKEKIERKTKESEER